MPTQSYELGERIEELESTTAGGDYLLSIAVPPDEPVGEALERVEEAYAQAEYLDGQPADEQVREVLDHAKHLLHRYEDEGTPEHGLALYVGAVDGEVVAHVFDDLPSPITESVYERGNEFDTDPLSTTTDSSGTYGLLVVERGGAVLGRLDGEQVEHVETIESQVMGKTKAGGQSAQRFERERERQKEEFFQEVGEEADRTFLGDDRGGSEDRDGNGAADGTSPADDAGDPSETGLDGLLVGGTTITVEEFLDGEYLDYRLRDQQLGGAFSVEYASEQGLHQLVERAQETLEAEADRPAREALDRFFGAIEADEPVVYGRDATEEALEYDAVDTVLLSDGLPAADVSDLAERTETEGGDVVVVPDAFDEGARFREAFGGVGALLRFPIE